MNKPSAAWGACTSRVSCSGGICDQGLFIPSSWEPAMEWEQEERAKYYQSGTATGEKQPYIHQQPWLITGIWGGMALQSSGLGMGTHCCCVLWAGCEMCRAPWNSWAELLHGSDGIQGFSLLVSFSLFANTLDILLLLNITWVYLPGKWIERACGFTGASFYKYLFILCWSASCAIFIFIYLMPSRW